MEMEMGVGDGDPTSHRANIYLFVQTPHIQSAFRWACFTVHWDKIRTDHHVPSTQHLAPSTQHRTKCLCFHLLTYLLP